MSDVFSKSFKLQLLYLSINLSAAVKNAYMYIVWSTRQQSTDLNLWDMSYTDDVNDE